MSVFSLVILVSYVTAEAAPPATPAGPPPAPSIAVPKPDSWIAARLTSGDPAMEAAWQRAVEGLEQRRANGFRELLSQAVGPFWGDGALLSRAYVVWAGDAGLLRASLERALHPAVVPPLYEGHRPLAAYSLLWPDLLLRYYEYTGDAVYTKAMAEFILPRLFAYFEPHVSPDGLLLGAGLAAWPDRLLDGVDAEAPPQTNAILNAFYYRALQASAELNEALRLNAPEYAVDASRVQDSFQAALRSPETGLIRDAPASDHTSVLANALSLCFGLSTADQQPAILALIREHGAACAPEFRPYVIEACFRAKAFRLGYDMLTFIDESQPDSSPIYLITEYLGGMTPDEPGWTAAHVVPRFSSGPESAQLTVPIATGRVSVKYTPGAGTRVLLPPGVQAVVDAPLGEPVMVKNVVSHGTYTLTSEQRALLETKDWSARVGDAAAVWVSVGEQMLRYIQGDLVLFQARCASSEAGIGSEMNSLKTPLGWHSVAGKIGEGAPWGQVFRSREATREVWQLGEDTREDLVLTRILLLTGEEPGLNKGGNVDSFARNIYIHGTNDEARLGIPSSHGCIRLSNDDVIEAFERIPEGTLVLITEF